MTPIDDGLMVMGWSNKLHLPLKSDKSQSGTPNPRRFAGIATLNLLASVHFVWFYISCTPSYLDLHRYELGLERTPFQHRMLMMFPLSWAHNMPLLIRLAKSLTALSAWFPGGVRPEGLMEAPIDLISVVITGLVARSMYRKASKTGVLTPYVYPVTLLMLTATYTIYTMHRLRFIYDLPSVGFFSVGLYLLYNRKPTALFIILFAIATINRETTAFLLLFYFLERVVQCHQLRPNDNSVRITLAALRSSWTTLVLLTGYWFLWHGWVARHFILNLSESFSRVWLNVGIILWPTSWIQILSVFAFTGPLVFVSRRLVSDKTLRIWQWVLPLWLLFMVRYGILIEIRIFGELIPYISCMAVLIAEEHICFSLERQPVSL